MSMPDFDERIISLCDELWEGDAKLHAAQLYLAEATGFGTERAREILNALGGIRADAALVNRLDLGPRLVPLINHLEEALEPN